MKIKEITKKTLKKTIIPMEFLMESWTKSDQLSKVSRSKTFIKAREKVTKLLSLTDMLEFEFGMKICIPRRE